MDRLAGIRTEYGDVGLQESVAGTEPWGLFETWLADALASPMHEPNAMVLATVADGRPSTRVVLLKGLDSGLVFYTNYRSRKARELAANPNCALLFPWHPIGRQVRIEGTAERVDAEVSDRYFATRPRDAQLGAWASSQSEPIDNREALEAGLAALRADAGPELSRPPWWGGFRVYAESFEFWQGRPGRLHDRLRYAWQGGRWHRQRLQP